ncbi:MAG: double zinc ribbon domain-containing protein [Planctomycetota bacterium]
MANQRDQGRVKPCLECDKLIPYEARICPHCKSDQAAPAKRACPHCAASIQKSAIYCTDCGKLTVPVAPAPTSVARDFSPGSVGDSVSILTLRSLEALALISLIWLVLDYMVL